MVSGSADRHFIEAGWKCRFLGPSPDLSQSLHFNKIPGTMCAHIGDMFEDIAALLLMGAGNG
jgi:hypothetical protein